MSIELEIREARSERENLPPVIRRDVITGELLLTIQCFYEEMSDDVSDNNKVCEQEEHQVEVPVTAKEARVGEVRVRKSPRIRAGGPLQEKRAKVNKETVVNQAERSESSASGQCIREESPSLAKVVVQKITVDEKRTLRKRVIGNSFTEKTVSSLDPPKKQLCVRLSKSLLVMKDLPHEKISPSPDNKTAYSSIPSLSKSSNSTNSVQSQREGKIEPPRRFTRSSVTNEKKIAEETLKTISEGENRNQARATKGLEESMTRTSSRNKISKKHSCNFEKSELSEFDRRCSSRKSHR